MSASWELQKAIYTRLTGDAAVTALVGDRIHDRVPQKARYPYISFGPSDFYEDDAECITARVETVQIDIWSIYQGGKKEAKQITDAVKAALHDYATDPGVNALVQMRVGLVRVIDDPDGITSHGVVQVEAMMEEH